jgi:Tfp pilus assembly ATPase PilU
MASGQGRIPAVEVMLNTPYIRKLIHEGKTLELLPQIEEGRHWGMQSFNQALYDLVKNSRVTFEDAMTYATSPEELKLMIDGIRSGVKKEPEGYLAG